MILALSGRIKAGKSTVANIIQLLIGRDKLQHEHPNTIFENMLNPNSINSYSKEELEGMSNWKQVAFAAKLKQIIALLIGCTVEQLEDQEFKSSPLGKEWIRYGYADGFQHIYKGGIKITQMINKECSKEKYEDEYRNSYTGNIKPIHIESDFTYTEEIAEINLDNCGWFDNFHGFQSYRNILENETSI